MTSEVVTAWIPIIMAASSMVVTIAVVMTRKDSSLHEKITNLAVKFDERTGHITDSQLKMEKHLSNHIAHNDERLTIVCNKIGNIDKQLYAHLQIHNENKK